MRSRRKDAKWLENEDEIMEERERTTNQKRSGGKAETNHQKESTNKIQLLRTHNQSETLWRKS